MLTKKAYDICSLNGFYLIMRYLLLLLYSLVILAPFSSSVFAQGGRAYCLRTDEKEACNFASMSACNSVALEKGGYCADNFRLYTSGGSKRYCLATRYGTRCDYNSRRRCVNEAGRMGEQGAACVDNYNLTGNERRKLEEEGASDCAEDDIECLIGIR